MSLEKLSLKFYRLVLEQNVSKAQKLIVTNFVSSNFSRQNVLLKSATFKQPTIFAMTMYILSYILVEILCLVLKKKINFCAKICFGYEVKLSSQGFAAKSPNVNWCNRQWEFYCHTFLLKLNLMFWEKQFSLMNLCYKNLSSNGEIENSYETHFSFECPSSHRLLLQSKIFSKTFQYI